MNTFEKIQPIIFLTHDLFDMFEKSLNTLSENEFNWIRVNFNCPENNPNFNKYLSKVKVIVSRKDLSNDHYRQAKKLKLIQLPISGYDQIDLKRAKKFGINVCNTSGANAISVAEHFFGLVLAHYRNIIHHHYTVINGNWINLKDYNEELFGKTLGIVGLGRIGKEVAKRAQAFGMDIIYNDIDNSEYYKLDKKKIYNHKLDKLLEISDVISFHVPLTKSTHKMINYNLLSKMKKNAVLVNLARGEIQVEEHIHQALAKNCLSGVILDVFSQEPFPLSNSLINFGEKVLLKTSNQISRDLFVKSGKAIFSPHSGPSKKARHRTIKFIIDNIKKMESNLKLESLCIDYD